MPWGIYCMCSNNYRVAVLTASDKGYAGQRADESGPAIRGMVQAAGYTVVAEALLPDEQKLLSAKMLEWCQSETVDLIVTTGGTGLSPRDCMPEATLAIARRQVPGIAEAMRAYSMQITPRAMLSRAVAVVCEKTLIVNLPGSPKAVREELGFVLPQLLHALDILTGHASECAEKPGHGHHP